MHAVGLSKNNKTVTFCCHQTSCRLERHSLSTVPPDWNVRCGGRIARYVSLYWVWVWTGSNETIFNPASCHCFVSILPSHSSKNIYLSPSWLESQFSEQCLQPLIFSFGSCLQCRKWCIIDILAKGGTSHLAKQWIHYSQTFWSLSWINFETLLVVI